MLSDFRLATAVVPSQRLQVEVGAGQTCLGSFSGITQPSPIAASVL